MNNTEDVSRLVAELFSLKVLPRSGWIRVLVPAGSVETVAAHSALSMMISTILAVGEGANVERSAILALFHDIGETRSGDITPVQANILKKAGVSKDAVDEAAGKEQQKGLPRELKNLLRKLQEEYQNNQTLEARIAHDADKLDQGIQGLIYRMTGFNTSAFIDEVAPVLQTESAKKLWNYFLGIPKEKLTVWWGGES